jgi:signal transduction histidine kinase
VLEQDELPVVEGDVRQLRQLFQNLIGNALKYRKPGVSPVVNITARVVNGHEAGLPEAIDKKNGAYHLIEVSDNGIGFEQVNAERIFNVFTRLHGNAEYKGTGVGLSIVRKVVQNHHGYIWAQSQPGEGATFNVLLPAE